MKRRNVIQRFSPFLIRYLIYSLFWAFFFVLIQYILANLGWINKYWAVSVSVVSSFLIGNFTVGFLIGFLDGYVESYVPGPIFNKVDQDLKLTFWEDFLMGWYISRIYPKFKTNQTATEHRERQLTDN